MALWVANKIVGAVLPNCFHKTNGPLEMVIGSAGKFMWEFNLCKLDAAGTIYSITVLW